MVAKKAVVYIFVRNICTIMGSFNRYAQDVIRDIESRFLLHLTTHYGLIINVPMKVGSNGEKKILIL